MVAEFKGNWNFEGTRTASNYSTASEFPFSFLFPFPFPFPFSFPLFLVLPLPPEVQVGIMRQGIHCNIEKESHILET